MASDDQRTNVDQRTGDDEVAGELAVVLRDAADERGTPGAAAGVLAGGKFHVAAHGVTNVEHPLPVTGDTLFQVGSITKTVTSAAVMLLVEERRLSLDDPLAKHLPDLATLIGADLEAVTLEQILSHQSGVDGDHLLVTRETDDLAVLADARRLFPPGTGFSYCNAGFSLAGAVIEAVAGRGYEEFVRDRLLRPVGMHTATFRADQAITHRVAAPHWVAEGTAHVIRGAGWQAGWELGRLDLPTGGLVASVQHLLAWCRFQWTGTAADGTTILGRESLERLHTPVVHADRLDDIGLDWFVRGIDSVTTIGHGGATVGYISDLLVAPERDMAFVGLTNATNGGAVNQAVRRWALERCAGIVERDPEPDPALSARVGADIERFVGRYLHAFAVLTVTAGAEPGTVVVTPSRRDDVDGGWQPPVEPPVTYAFFADDHVVSLDAVGPTRVLRFGPDAVGSTTAPPADWLLSGYRRAPRIG